MFLSRKFRMAVAGLILVILTAILNQERLDPDTLTNAIMGIVSAYMIATAYEDGQKAKAEAAPITTVVTPAENISIITSDAPVGKP